MASTTRRQCGRSLVSWRTVAAVGDAGSDEDCGWSVGERDVDQKASDFIATFHQKLLVV
jgi:hypothetical protein